MGRTRIRTYVRTELQGHDVTLTFNAAAQMLRATRLNMVIISVK
jgi:hypothetical protein